MDTIALFMVFCSFCTVCGQRIAVIGNIPFVYRPTSAPVSAKATYAEYLQSYINQLQQIQPSQSHSIAYQLPSVLSQPSVYYQPALYQQQGTVQASSHSNAQQALQQSYQRPSQQQMYEPLMMPAPVVQPQQVYQQPQHRPAFAYQPQPQPMIPSYAPPPRPPMPVQQPVYRPPAPKPPPPYPPHAPPPRPHARPPAPNQGRSYDRKPPMRPSYGPPKKIMKKKRRKTMKRYDDDKDYDDDYDHGHYDDERDHGGYEDDHETGYGKSKRKKKKKLERIYVPVRVQKKKKKMKIVTIMPGFYVAGGTQIFGKFKSLKKCEKACAATPSCFAGDFNPWLHKCYLHTNFTACGSIRGHKKLTHFKKVPCQVPEAPEGRITLGAQLFRGIEQKGIKSLSDCLKKCASAGTGIPASVVNIGDQLCFGIDYDFGSHKCYFHVDNTNFRICPNDGSPPLVPRDLVPNPAVINIILCPGP